MLKCLVYLFFVVTTHMLLIGCQQSSPPFECTDKIGCVTIKTNEPVKIGVIQDFSGGAAIFGGEQVNGVKLAVNERDNRFLGHPIDLQIEDEGCTPEGGANAALRIVADPQIIGIIGTTCSKCDTKSR
jgi:branched-chain amino acid transport system substrate-binding protein